VGVDESDLVPPTKAFHSLTTKESVAWSAATLRRLTAALGPLTADIDQLTKAQAAENARIDQQTAVLKAAHPNDIEAIRKDGQAALIAGRNEGTLAGFLKLFKLDRDVARMEAVSGSLAGTDLDRVARAVATVQVHGNALHTGLVASMPDKVVHISLRDQRVWAYDHGKAVFDTVVTTGKPELQTDIGPMSVLWKASPWTMQSPWPKGSPYWYPDSKVRKVLWFHNSGEGLHDAPWRTWFGPGSDIGDGTHGCVNMPGTTVDFLYDWAPIGTPVIVTPGDGSPTAEQLKKNSVEGPNASTAVHGS
jgi:lipoprotein-anchoring transpeptidase ErfK/SrfK